MAWKSRIRRRFLKKKKTPPIGRDLYYIPTFFLGFFFPKGSDAETEHKTVVIDGREVVLTDAQMKECLQFRPKGHADLGLRTAEQQTEEKDDINETGVDAMEAAGL